jgi:23S rRNA (guanine745-N1)-methyltransferase
VLACTVRGCELPLQRMTGTLVCARGHSYDVARSGYVNLLQPQDRRSPSAGDAAAAVAARARLIAAGVGQPLVDAVIASATALDLDDDAAVVDLGAGGGETLAALAAKRPIEGIGIDLSTAAATTAARRFPSLTWVVANADRRLPVVDRRVELVISVNARRNPAECARVLTRPGYLLIAVPASDDLIELRELVQGERAPRDRGSALMEEHESAFRLIDETTVREQRRLERDQLMDLLRGTYRGARSSAAAHVAALTSLEVTLASELRLFAPR